MPRQIGSAHIFALVAILGVTLDLIFASPYTGIPSTLVMLATTALIARAIARGSEVVGIRSLWRLELVLIATLLGLALARGYVVVAELTGGGEDEVTSATAARTYDAFFLILAAAVAGVAAAAQHVLRLGLRLAQRPALLFASSFGAMIAVGTLLLTTPLAVHSVADVSPLDSLFTITSAVCVTGLSVHDISTHYTTFGQVVILLGIQLGGIGIMTLAALALMMVRDPSLRSQLRYAEMLDARTLTDLRTQVRSIIFGTLLIEGLGFVLLWALFRGDPRLHGDSPAFAALFHAISAFCNAGFSTFTGGLAPFVDAAGVQAVIMTLIVLGGLGFPVILEVVRLVGASLRWRLRRGPRPDRLGLTARTVLKLSLWLIVGGALAIFALEYSRSLGHLSPVDKALAALFASINARTAGFNTVDLGAMRDATLLFTCSLMFIGGSPASTAGGIKTTTAAVFLASLRAELRGCEPELGRRSLPVAVLRRAIAVTALSLCIALTALLLLTLTEEMRFIDLTFEAVSAFATTGLSTGITGDLSSAGKLIVTATMFVGRVGPLTIALAVGSDRNKQPYRLASEGLPIG